MARFGFVNGWVLVAILLVAYALSFVDRQILSLLVEDLRHDLAIGDTQIGLLQGPAFGVFYAVMGLPCGWLADRVSRTRLIAAGLLLWTTMTISGGFCDSFSTLFLTRMGVGVGEAALVPAAVSLLSDSFPAQRRALPLAIFTAGISLGAGLSLFLGGTLVDVARDGTGNWPVLAPFLTGRAPWQTVLILAGLLGIPVAVLIGLLPEPERETSSTKGGTPAAGLVTYLRRHRAVFVPLLLGTTLLYLFSNALSAWVPSLFIREFGWTPAQVGARIGVVAGALCGNLLSGAIATALGKRGRHNAAVITIASGALLLLPVAIFGPLLPGAGAAQAAIGAIYFSIALCFGVATAGFVAVTPPPIRGQMIALYLLLGNLIGLGLGPPTVGIILEKGLGDPRQVGLALSVVAALSVTAGAIFLLRALKPHAALAAQMETGR